MKFEQFRMNAAVPYAYVKNLKILEFLSTDGHHIL